MCLESLLCLSLRLHTDLSQLPSTHMMRFTPWTSVEEKVEVLDKLPRHVFELIDFQDFPARVGQIECFIGKLNFAMDSFSCKFMGMMFCILTNAIF